MKLNEVVATLVGIIGWIFFFLGMYEVSIVLFVLSLTIFFLLDN